MIAADENEKKKPKRNPKKQDVLSIQEEFSEKEAILLSLKETPCFLSCSYTEKNVTKDSSYIA